MLVDLAVSNYVRAVYATQTDMESTHYVDHYGTEMYEIMMEGNVDSVRQHLSFSFHLLSFKSISNLERRFVSSIQDA